MLDSFGARLRQRRESQGIALATIAEQTKIKLSMLDALERDDVSGWPAGIFRRAYVRTYAHAIGLDPDAVVRDFLEAHPEPDQAFEAALAAALASDAARNGGPPTRIRTLVGSALGSFSRLRRGSSSEEAGVPAALPGLRATAGSAKVAAPSIAPPVEQAPVVPARAGVPPAHIDVDLAPGIGMPDLPEPVVGSIEARADDASIEAAPPGHVRTPAAARTEPDLLAVSHLCTALGRAQTSIQIQSRLAEAAGLLEAAGLIVWLWDPSANGLRPALAHGYSDRVLAQLPAVRRDADNATAAAFRMEQTCAIDGGERASGALVVPLLTPEGCAGVLAIELQPRRPLTASVRAVAEILTSLLSQLARGARTASNETSGHGTGEHETIEPPETIGYEAPRSAIG